MSLVYLRNRKGPSVRLDYSDQNEEVRELGMKNLVDHIKNFGLK